MVAGVLHALDASLRSATRPGGPHYAQDRTKYRTTRRIGTHHALDASLRSATRPGGPHYV